MSRAPTVYLLYTFAVIDLWKCAGDCQADSDKPTSPTSLFILMRREQQKTSPVQFHLRNRRVDVIRLEQIEL